MMAPSHLVATVAVALAWGLLRARSFTRMEWRLALAFGVLVDVDHALMAPAYFAQHGLAGFDVGTMLAHGAGWQGFMHTPWALALVAPAILWSRSLLPLAFWGLHMVQDFVLATRFIHWGGPGEWAFIVAVTATAVALTRVQLARETASGRPVSVTAAVLGLARR